MKKDDIKYEDYKKMIYDMGWRWNRKLNLDVDTLVAEACVIFAEILNDFDEKKSKFSTLLYIAINNRFKNIMKEQRRFKNQGISVEYLEELHAPVGNFENDYIFKNLIDSLSEEAKKIISIVFNTPADLLKILPQPMLSLSQLTQYLVNTGWERAVISKSINEIREILHER